MLGWQAALVRDLGCERIICLCESTTPEILELQREIEGEGGEFHAVRSSIQLVALLRSDDLLVFMLDGLVVDGNAVRNALGDGNALAKSVLTIPANHALSSEHPDDFERIDASRSWAGLAVMRAAHAQKLADLPPDGEVMSLLIRIALQSGTPGSALPIEEMEEGDWLLASDEKAVIDRESALIARFAPSAPVSGPFSALAAWSTRKLAPLGLSRGGPIAVAVSGVSLLASLVSASFGYATFGIAVAAVGAFGFALALAWKRLNSGLLGSRPPGRIWQYLSDLIAVLATATLVMALFVEGAPTALLALPILTMGLSELAGRAARPLSAAFWRDRALHLALLALCSGAGLLAEGLAFMGITALAQMLLLSARN